MVDERGYKQMKTGISTNNINAEYMYAVKQDEKALQQTELYEVPDPDGYENVLRNFKGICDIPETDPGVALNL